MVHRTSILQLLLLVLLIHNTVADGEETTKKPKTRSCSKFEFNSLWSSSLRNSPLMATPLLIDVDGDSLRDIIVPSYSGEVYAIHGENGHIIDNWPFYLEDRAFYASPLPYDLDKDGDLDVLLTTTDAEILFLRTDNTLFHGETIKIPPLRVTKDWYNLDKKYLDNLISELTNQVGNRLVSENTPPNAPSAVSDEAMPTKDAFSTIKAQMGDEINPLYSRHQPQDRPSGVDPRDNNHVYIDPHVLATPILFDLNEDGIKSELIVPVSYYFDKYQYGDADKLTKTHLPAEDLLLYCAEGIVIIDIEARQVISHRVLGLTKVDSNQPAYLLNSPTVVKLSPSSPVSVIIGSVTGKLHVLDGVSLQDREGFPLSMASISAQVAVEDLVGNDGVLEMVVGDNSGNVVCVNAEGIRMWEHETKSTVESGVRFANVTSGRNIEVVFATKYGDLWVLDGTSGKPVDGYPLMLNSLVHASVFLMHLSPKSSSSDYHISAIVPAVTGLYVVDLNGKCVDRITSKSHEVPHSILSDHIDPFNPGIEVLVTSLTGELILFSTSTIQPSDFEVSIETWTSDVSHGNVFTHKQSSFALVCGRGLTPRDAVGRFFKMRFQIYDNRTAIFGPAGSTRKYYLQIYIGNKYSLYHDVLTVNQDIMQFEVDIPTPPIPIRSTVTLEICNLHYQCDSATFNIKFNQSFKETFGLCLALPFFVLVASYLWLLRNEDTVTLPTVIKTQKWT